MRTPAGLPGLTPTESIITFWHLNSRFLGALPRKEAKLAGIIRLRINPGSDVSFKNQQNPRLFYGALKGGTITGDCVSSEISLEILDSTGTYA